MIEMKEEKITDITFPQLPIPVSSNVRNFT